MDHSYRWIIVALGALMTCISAGAMFSLAVFLGPMAEATGWSRTGISVAMTIDFLAMGVGGFAWGAASDRFGPRRVTLAGAVLLGSGLLLASRATSLLGFQLSYGLLVGLASGAFIAPMIAATTGWFETQRGLAVSLVSVGIGVAPVTVSPFVGWLAQTMDWRSAMAIVAALCWVTLIPAALFVRAPPVSGGEGGARQAEPAPSAVTALTSLPFAALAGTFFLCCAAHAGPIFHMISYATFCGIAPMAAVSIYGVEGLAGLGGRLILGTLADRFGAKPVLIGGLLVQAMAIAAYAGADRLAAFYALSVVFGAAYGGVMPLYAVLARDYFPQSLMGTVLGAATMLSSLGMALGPLGGGLIFDAFGGYTWLYLASAGLGLGAAMIALAFPKPTGSGRGEQTVAA